MNITTISLSSINPAEYNPRIITKDEFSGLKASLETFGQQENLIVNKDMTLISGHQRMNAMLALGWTEAVCNVVDLDKHEEKKLNVIMNSQAISGTWDDLKLSEILEELKLDDNYTSLRLDALEPLDLSVDVEEDDPPEASTDPPISQLGEVYQLGRHRVMCGDSTDKASVEMLMGGAKANMVFTDPPYNVDYGNTMKDKMRGSDRTILNDKMSGEDFYQFMHDAIAAFKPFVSGSVYIAMSSSELDTLQSAFRANDGHWSTFIIWVKNTFTMGRSDYQRQYEPILYGWFEKSSHYWSGVRNLGDALRIEDAQTNPLGHVLLRADNLSMDVWEFPKPTKSKEHPTMKPVGLVARAVVHSSKKGQIVLDTFGGSGTTLIAAEQTDRICYGMELDPKYVDVIRKRYAKFIGKEESWQSVTQLVDQQ